MTRVPAALGTTAERPFPAVLWIAAAVSLVAALSPRDLWAPDEPRAGVVARAMVEDGRWLVPHLNGEPYPEKPPLVYWLMSVSGILLGGLSAFAARLPGALATACAVFSVARLGRRWFGDAAMGDTAALLFATTELVLWNGSRAGLDLPMTAFVLLAVEAGSALVARRSVPGAVGFGAALGLGLLAKGPHALLVPVGAMVGGCVAAGAAKRLLDPRWLLGLALSAGIVCAWLLPALAAAPEAYGERLLGQLGDRVAGENVPHKHGPEHLWLLLLAVGLPWTVSWLAGLDAARRLRRAAPEDRFGLGACLGGVALPLVLLSIPASKRDLYLIPLLPLLALLAAYALHRLPERGLHPWAVRFAAGLLALVAVAAFAAPFLGAKAWPGEEGDAVSGGTLGEGSLPFVLGGIGLVAAVGSFAGFRLARRAVAGSRLVAIGFAAVWMTASSALLPAFDDAKTFAVPATLADRAAPKAVLSVVGLGDDPSTVLWSFRRTRAESMPLFETSESYVWVAGDVLVYVSTGRAEFASPRRLWRGRVGGRTYTLWVSGSPP
jgi:4-amino-4-deoxy-L-arabinose transferase-like glycosyltransferase